MGCDSTAPLRTEETFGRLIIDAVGFEPNSKDRAVPSSTACNGFQKRRPDLLWVNEEGGVAVVVEIDEHSHVQYEASCEVKKISEQNQQIQHLEGCENIPVFTIRVNPDEYDQRRVLVKVRAAAVGNKVKELLNGSYERNGFAMMYFCCYHSSAQHLIAEHAKTWKCEVLEC